MQSKSNRQMLDFNNMLKAFEVFLVFALSQIIR